MTSLTDILLLLSGFLFSFLVPGFLVIETFFKSLPKIQKLPLYMVLSVEIFTTSVYLAGLVLGLNRLTVILVMIIFAILLCIFLLRRKKVKIFSRTSLLVAICGAVVYLVFFLALSKAIFYPLGNNFVMGADNWQDTAMHISIIESISQGNFPPQSPYYSGKPLDYYYFVDFHSAIINILYGHFFPRILVFDNPFFAAMFFVSVFALAYSLTKNKVASFLSSLFALFYGNQMYTFFARDVLNGGSPLVLLAKDGYALDFSGLYQVTPMVDYFLQNRPMMFGLPLFVVATLLIFDGFRKQKLNRIFLASILVGLSIKFQLFAFLASGLAFIVGFFIFLRKKTFRFSIKSLFVFGLPIGYLGLLSVFIFPGQSSILEVFKSTFHLGPWEEQSLVWHLKFLLANFGVGIPLVLLGLIFSLIKSRKNIRWLFFTFILFIILFSMPYLMRFTIFNRDMFKFFYLATIPLAILTAFFVKAIFKLGILGKLIALLIGLSLIFTSVLVLIWSHESKTIGYSVQDYVVGMWIRENTPQKSVFIGYPTVHSPATDIGGRLRVTSYINWPYSHGFNKGSDSVFARVADIDKFYGGQSGKEVLNKYKVNYVFYGPEEISHYPEAVEIFKSESYLNLIYNSQGVKIYEVKN